MVVYLAAHLQSEICTPPRPERPFAEEEAWSDFPAGEPGLGS